MINRQKTAFYAGLAFGVALFIIRVSVAETFGDVLFAVALTLAEFSIVWLWEKKGRQLGDDLVGWFADVTTRGRLLGLCRVADENFAYRELRLAGNLDAE